MGFSGGGSNILLPHTHDGRVSQDGGPLQFNNVTQSQSAQGEIFYSDGVALQQLAYPAVPAGETLQAAAASTAPSWVAPAGGALYEKIGSVTLGGSAATLGLSFTAVDQVDISKIAVVANFQKSVMNAVVYLNVNGISTASYDWGLMQQSTAATGGTSGTSNNNWVVLSNNAGSNCLSTIDITCNAVTDNIQASGMTVSGGGSDHSMYLRGWNTTAGQTSIDEVEYSLNTGVFAAGSRLDIYKILV